MNCPIESYEAIKKQLESVFRSRLQMIILLSLGDGEKSLSDFRSLTTSSSQALIPNIRRLEESNLILRGNHGYQLTSLGICFRKKIVHCIDWLSVIHDSGKFWRDHYVDGIPLKFLHEISDLFGSDLISNCNTELYRTFSRYSQIIQNAEYIHRITSILSPFHIDIIRKRVYEGIPVEVVTDKAVAEELYSESHIALMKDLQKYPNFRVYVSYESLFLCLTVSDTHLALGMYYPDAKKYDSNQLLINSSAESRRWGENVFSYYKERSLGVISSGE